MRFENFVGSRLTVQGAKSFTRVIVRFAIFAVAAGLAVMIVATAMIRGFKKEISSKIFGFWGHIQITDTRTFQSYEAYPLAYDPAMIASIDSISRVVYEEPVSFLGMHFGNQYVQKKTRGGVRHIQGYAQLPGIIRTRESIEGIILKGVGGDFDWAFMAQYIVDGEALTQDGEATDNEILLSEVTARRMDVSAGDKCIVYFIQGENQVRKPFRVSGIYRTGLEDYDKKYALTHLDFVQQQLGWENNEVAGLEVFLDDLDDADVINEYIYLEELPGNMFSQTIRRRFPNIFEWLELQDINEALILVLTLVVCLINMITALLILILERTNMIGILKALGAQNWLIQKIFIVQAGYITVRGLVLGNVIGLGLCLVQKYFKVITLNEADYYLSHAPIELSLSVILLLNLGFFLITLLVLFIPSTLVLRIKPVKTIQFK